MPFRPTVLRPIPLHASILNRRLWVLLPLLCLVFLLGRSSPAVAQETSDSQLYLPLIAGPQPGSVLIGAAYIDSARIGEADEALLLWNTSAATVDLDGWRFRVNSREATFPDDAGVQLPPGAALWCTAEADAFVTSFGESPGCEWAADDDPAVPNLTGTALRLANTGGVIQLLNPDGQVVDTLLYGDESGPAAGWNGPPAQIYARGALGAEGQIWQRKALLNPRLRADRNRAADWAGDLADPVWGRRARRPGWGGWMEDGLVQPPLVQATAAVTVAVAPEGLYTPLAQTLAAAQQTIDLSLYTFEHPELAQTLAEAARRGVAVRMLLEGGPPGGVSDLQRWCVQLMAQAGVEVRYLAMQDDAPRGLRPRYRYAHAKFGVVDGDVSLVGSENFSWDAMPIPEEGNEPPGGRRGAYLLTDARPVADHLTQLFAEDWSPAHFLDRHPYTPDDETYGDPPPDYTVPPPPEYAATASPFADPVVATGAARFMVASAPENVLHPQAGLHGLLQQAGAGDAIHLVQLYEHLYWGDGDSNPVADPNPRLELLLDAARRGATVCVLLDSLFDDPQARRSNRATAAYLNDIAAAEGLDLAAAVGNPTGGGIHAKTVLVQLDGETWSAVGSLNGGEVSHKINREVMLMVDHPDVYNRLLDVFLHDWALRIR